MISDTKCRVVSLRQLSFFLHISVMTTTKKLV